MIKEIKEMEQANVSVERETRHVQGKDANLTQKGPSWSVRSTLSIVPPPNICINAVVFNVLSLCV